MIVQQGVNTENAEKYPETGIQMMQDLALIVNKRSGIPLRNYNHIKVKNLSDSINKIIGIDPVTLDSLYFDADSQQSEADKQKNAQEIFDKYTKAFNLRKSDFDDWVIIDLKQLFKEFSNLYAQEGYTYSIILAA